MKKILSLLALAALTIGLLGSCSKINERIDSLEKKVDGIENNQIASIGEQIAAINQSISDLETIRTNIQTLIAAKNAMGEDIAKLKEADITLEGKINDLKTYVDTELAKYATIDWVKGTFATLVEQNKIIADIEQLKQDLAGLDSKLDQAIANLDSSLKGWVNEQLSGYYTIAQIDAKIKSLQDEIDILNTDNETNKTKIAELETKLNNLSAELTQAKSTIKTEYEAAIAAAITEYDGTITQTINQKIAEVNATITALTGRVEALETTVAALSGDVDALKAMIQSVSITPAYSDGSVEALDGILTLKCIVKPAEALSGIESLKDSLLIYADSVKVKTKAASAYMEIKVSEASVLDAAQGAITLKADISEYLPKGADQVLTVALDIKNGISDFTTEFVPVYANVTPLPEGALAGKFTVAEGKKVHFSQGNLVATIDATGAPTAWKFAANQYDCLGEGGANKTIGQAAGDVDLFGWSTASTTYGISTSTSMGDYFGDFVDWGKAYCANNSITPDKTWRTLTTAEWQYLFNSRTNASILYKYGVTVCDKTNCLIIAPDNWDTSANPLLASYDATAWATAEAAGLVCLPAAGGRYGSKVLSVGGYGYYWSSTTHVSDRAYRVYFNSSDVRPDDSELLKYGCSVRLLTESN